MASGFGALLCPPAGVGGKAPGPGAGDPLQARRSRLPMRTGPGLTGRAAPSFPAPPGSRSVCGLFRRDEFFHPVRMRLIGTSEERHRQRSSEKHTDAQRQQPQRRGTNGRKRRTPQCVQRRSCTWRGGRDWTGPD